MKKTIIEKYKNTKVNSKYHSTGSVNERHLTKEEFENGEQGIVGWNMHRDELVFKCGSRTKVNR